jgi:hypothetical protein
MPHSRGAAPRLDALLYRSSRLNSSETDVPIPGHRRNATLAGTDRSIFWPLQTPAAHLCQPELRLSQPASAGTAAAGTALPSAQPVKPTLVHLLTNPEWGAHSGISAVMTG